MPDQTDLGLDSGGPDLDRLREHDADFTPAPVVRQGLGWLRRHITPPRRMLDPAAGAGVFGMAARETWGDIRLDAIEPRAEEFDHLVRWYDTAWTTTLGAALDSMAAAGPTWDIIATNPPFRHWAYFVERLLPRLAESGTLMLLGHSGWGQAKATAEVFAKHPPWLQLRIVGRVGFRGPGINPKTGKPWGVDLRDYSWWLWRGREFPNDAASWNCLNLPRLPGCDRQWRTRPGTEEPCD